MSILSSRHNESVALITGGAQGVGLAIAKQLVNEGCWRIVLAGRDAQKGEKAVEELHALGCETLFIVINLQCADECMALVDKAIARFGEINLLVNAAGSAARGTLADTTLETWENVFNTNTRAPFLLMQEFVKHRLERGSKGGIVNILSQCVYCGQSYLAAYSASKAALATLTKNVANAYRYQQIRCNAILPGWMDTPGEDATQRRYHGAGENWLETAEANQPMKQLCKPEQLAMLASYMLSDDAGVMTGSLVDYDQNIAGAYPE